MKSLDTLLADSFGFFRDNFLRFCTIILLLYLPLRLLHIFLESVGYLPDANLVYALIAHKSKGSLLYILVSIVVMSASTLAGLLFMVWTNVFIAANVRGQRLSPLEVLKLSGERLWPFVELLITLTAKLLLWSVCFILPGIYFAVLYAQAAPAFFVDGKRGVAALAASREVISKDWKRFVLFSLVICVLTSLLFKLGDVVFANIFGVNEEGELRVLPTIGKVLFDLYLLHLMTFTATFNIFFYREMKGDRL